MGRRTKEDILSKYELDEIDKKMLRHVLEHPGMTDTELGVLVGYARKVINKRRNAPKFKKALDGLMQEPLDTLRARLRKAAQTFVRGLDSTNEKLRLDTCYKMLLSEGVLKKDSEGPIGFLPTVIKLNKLNGDAEIYETQFIEKKKDK